MGLVMKRRMISRSKDAEGQGSGVMMWIGGLSPNCFPKRSNADVPQAQVQVQVQVLVQVETQVDWSIVGTPISPMTVTSTSLRFTATLGLLVAPVAGLLLPPEPEM